MKPNLLSVQNLSVTFKKDDILKEVIHSISFDVEKGRTLAIVGESGSGKSVTSLAIMRLLPSAIANVNSGEVNFFQNQEYYNLLTINQREIQNLRGNRISMIFQEPMTSLNPVLTCGFQVREVLELHKKMSKKEAEAEVLRLFQEVKLPEPQEALNKYPHQLSGGQKQRVMIAMAIACDPDLLIADEPTTALDVTVQKSILELLKELQAKKGMSIIFITHDLGIVSEIADNVAVMFQGKIVEQGSKSEIFKNAKHPYTQSLLACRPRTDVRLEKLPTVSDFLEATHPFLETIISSEEWQSRQQKIQKQSPLLIVKNLCKYYPKNSGFFFQSKEFTKAVENVNFEVYPGETLGLVGESGCGKTSLIRSILRLIEPTSGEIIFDNQNLLQLSKAQMNVIRKNIQIVFQDPYSSLNPKMSIGNAITEPIWVHKIFKTWKECKDRTMFLLEQVGLNTELYNRLPHEFSGGQRQRICIARALGTQPKLLICDESVSALDVSVQAQVLNLFNDLKKQFNLTYVFISHDLGVVKYMSDRLMVMQNGKIVEFGDSDSIYANPQVEYTKILINSIPKII